jgi:hypothetical protein
MGTCTVRSTVEYEPKTIVKNVEKNADYTTKKMDKNPYNSLVLESSTLKNRPDSSSQKFDGKISGTESRERSREKSTANLRGDVEVGSSDDTTSPSR